jgi:hypothetical protein
MASDSQPECTPSPAKGRKRGKRVSAKHTLDRVRNNQRRHRARRKEYIESLERQLAISERLLNDARSEVHVLREKLAALVGPTDLAVEGDPAERSLVESATMGNWPRRSSNLQEHTLTFDDSRDQPQSLPALEGCGETSLSSSSSSTCCSTAKDAANLRPTDMSVNRAAILDQTNYWMSPDAELSYPDATTAESTTLCTEAYELISQQNLRGLGQADIETWLWTGFRKPKRPGDGCRVENSLLLGFLAFISDP